MLKENLLGMTFYSAPLENIFLERRINRERESQFYFHIDQDSSYNNTPGTSRDTTLLLYLGSIELDTLIRKSNLQFETMAGADSTETYQMVSVELTEKEAELLAAFNIRRIDLMGNLIPLEQKKQEKFREMVKCVLNK